MYCVHVLYFVVLYYDVITLFFFFPCPPNLGYVNKSHYRWRNVLHFNGKIMNIFFFRIIGSHQFCIIMPIIFWFQAQVFLIQPKVHKWLTSTVRDWIITKNTNKSHLEVQWFLGGETLAGCGLKVALLFWSHCSPTLTERRRNGEPWGAERERERERERDHH